MITVFPQPYPDELLYSLCARYSRLMGYKNKDNSTLRHLFGYTVMTAVVDLPIYLDVFANQLEFLGGPSADELINQHTLLPYYVAFHPVEQREPIRAAMRSDGRPYSMLGLSSFRVDTPTALRYCPACAAKERVRYGEAYWHRLHQLPGMIVCPEHEAWLEDSVAKVSMLRSRRVFDAAEKIIPQAGPVRTFHPNREGRLLVDLAYRTKDALLNPPLGIEQRILRERYRYALAERGLAAYSGYLHSKAVRAAFREFCPEGTLSKLGIVQASNEWLVRVLRQPGKKGSHTLHHLLLQAFLGLDKDDLTRPVQPFGAGPWPCLNRAHDHYGEGRITEVRVHYSESPVRPVATFVCPCGFGYRRAGPDRTPEDAFHRTRISSYGLVWLRTLRRGWLDSSLPLETLSQQLGVSGRTVRAQAGVLGLLDRPRSWEAKTGSRGVKALTPKSRKSAGSTFAQGRDDHRNAWLRAWRERPEASVTTLRRLLPGTYRWLCRNDRDWYDKNKPSRRVTRTVTQGRDWKRQDAELADRLRCCARYLYAQDPPVKVTRTRLGREVGALSLLFSYRDKLPKCMRALNELEETREELAIRRINSAATRLRQSGDRQAGDQVSRFRFVQIAKLGYELRTRQSPHVKQALEQALTKLNDKPEKQFD